MPIAYLPLSAHHDLTQFDCGEPALNDYLRQNALEHHNLGVNRGTVAVEDTNPKRVIGYYAICQSTIGTGKVSLPILGLPAGNNPPQLPVVLLARFAVDKPSQGNGIGTNLLMHAFKTVIDNWITIGGVAIVVDSKPNAINYYKKRNFIQIGQSHRFYLPMATVRALNL